MRDRSEYAAALLAVLLGGAGTLLIATRHWQHAVLPRQRPLPNDLLDISGRTINSTPTALALVALAGVVALLATRGWARRAVGVALALAGVGIGWLSLAGLSALGAGRVRSLDASAHSGVEIDDSVVPQVDVHAGWPWLSALCGLLVLLGGVLALARGQHWSGLSTRYQAPAETDDDAQRRSDVALWNALDQGADPTADSADAAPADRRADGADTLG